MRAGRVFVVLAGCVALLILLASNAAAQTIALSGRVVDAQGGAVAGATVTVTRSIGGSAIVRTSAADGVFSISGLSAGQVIVEIVHPGFRRFVEAITLAHATQTSRIFALQIAGVDESVVVTAAGVPQAVRETSKAVTAFDRAEVRQRRHTTIADVVRTAPGVQVRDTGGPGQLGSVRIRGLRSEAAAVLVDGFRFRDAASTQADATAFFTNLNVMAIDRVEVLRGSGSSLFGTNAVGGALNLVSRTGGGPLGGEAHVDYGSLGQTRARGSVSGSALNQRLAFAIGGLAARTLDGLDGDDASESTGAHGTVRFQVDPKTNVWARFIGSADRVNTNSSPTTFGIPVENIPDQTIVQALAVSPDQMARFDRGQPVEVGTATFFPGSNDPDASRRSAFGSLAVRLEHQQSPDVLWQLSYQRLHTARTHRDGPRGPGFQNPTESLSRFKGDIDTLELRGTGQLRPWLSVFAGYEFERETYFEHLDDNAPAPDRLITESDVSETSHAVFGAMQVTLADRQLQISVSGRAQGFRLGTPAFSTVGTASPYDALAFDAPPGAVTGDISAAYFVPASGTKIRAHAGSAYRAPALYERFGGGFFADPVTSVILFSPFGDPRLSPDRYRTIDAGVDQYLFGDRAVFSATVFGIDATSLTEFDFNGGIDPSTDPLGRYFGYVNGAGGSSTGLELSLDARLAPGFGVRGSYAHTNSTMDEDLAVSGFFRTPSVFGDTAAVIVSHDWRNRLTTAFEVFHASSSYTALFANGRARAYEFPGFTTASLTASYRITRSAIAPLRAYIRLDNLFDETYYLGGWRAPGRTSAVGMSVGF